MGYQLIPYQEASLTETITILLLAALLALELNGRVRHRAELARVANLTTLLEEQHQTVGEIIQDLEAACERMGIERTPTHD